MGAYPSKMLAKGTPDALPLETNTVHVQRGYLYQFLKTKLLWAILISKLFLGNPTKVFYKVDNSISI